MNKHHQESQQDNPWLCIQRADAHNVVNIDPEHAMQFKSALCAAKGILWRKFYVIGSRAS